VQGHGEVTGDKVAGKVCVIGGKAPDDLDENMNGQAGKLKFRERGMQAQGTSWGAPVSSH